jgi:NitT/TauT family transport system substrate-binding protein
MTGRTDGRSRARLFGVTIALASGALLLFGSSAASAPGTKHRKLATITLNGLPIANGLPLDLGIKKGFFSAQGIEINKRNLQSGNDIVLALANNNGDIGYVGWVPAIIGRTQGIRLQALAASDVEGTSVADNWQNIMVKGSSSIRTPQDLAGKSIAVNALKGVGEVMIRAALKKVGVNQSSIRLVAMPFTAMRSALQNGQVDAVWFPEPFVSQALNLDDARIVMAPGPVLGRFWPIGTYVAQESWIRSNPTLARGFRIAMNQSLTYAQSHPGEIREMLPAGTQNVRLPIWTTTIDMAKLAQMARYMREYDVISTLPNLTQLVPATVSGGKTLQGTVGNRFIALRLDGKAVKNLVHGKYTFVVTDQSKAQNFMLDGPGVHKQTSVRGIGRSTWTVTLKKGTYTFRSSARASLRRTFRVR